MQSIVDIEICKILTDLNVTDPLTKIISQEKHDHTLVNPLGVDHMTMWTMGVNHMVMWIINVKSHGDVN